VKDVAHVDWDVASPIGLVSQITYMFVFLANEMLLYHTMLQLKSSKEHGEVGVVA
jgi:hypothetical protein